VVAERISDGEILRIIKMWLKTPVKEEGACFVVKNIGKPCAGKLHARFDEGGLASQPWCSYLGTARRKGRKQMSSPKADNASSLLYPELLDNGHNVLREG